jgi:hypothetical protein
MENNKNETYYFPDQYVVVAYDNTERAAGIFLTSPNEAFTKEELFGYFGDVNPLYLVAAELPEVEGLTRNNYHSKIPDFITDLYENNLDELDILYYIPVTLH